MKATFAATLGAGLVALASQLAFSTSASAACGPGYKPVRHSSGNTVCVLDVGGPTKFKAKTPVQPQPAVKPQLKTRP